LRIADLGLRIEAGAKRSQLEKAPEGEGTGPERVSGLHKQGRDALATCKTKPKDREGQRHRGTKAQRQEASGSEELRSGVGKTNPIYGGVAEIGQPKSLPVSST
jgi:hypothetical protein